MFLKFTYEFSEISLSNTVKLKRSIIHWGWTPGTSSEIVNRSLATIGIFEISLINGSCQRAIFARCFKGWWRAGPPETGTLTVCVCGGGGVSFGNNCWIMQQDDPKSNTYTDWTQDGWQANLIYLYPLAKYVTFPLYNSTKSLLCEFLSPFCSVLNEDFSLSIDLTLQETPTHLQLVWRKM